MLIRNNCILKLILVLGLFPVASLAMDQSDSLTERKISRFSEKVTSGVKDGSALLINATKKTVTLVAKAAYDHPVYTVAGLSACYGVYWLCSRMITKEDLLKGGKELNDHREGLVNGLIAHQKRSEEKNIKDFDTVDACQAKEIELLQALDVAGASKEVEALDLQTRKFQEDQEVAFKAIQASAQEDKNVVLNEINPRLEAIQDRALALVKKHAEMQNDAGELLVTLDSQKESVDALDGQLRSNSDGLTTTQTEITHLAAKFKELNDGF